MTRKSIYRKTKTGGGDLEESPVKCAPRVLDPLITQNPDHAQDPVEGMSGASSLFSAGRAFDRIDALVHKAGEKRMHRRPGRSAGVSDNKTKTSMAPDAKSRRAPARYMILPDIMEARRGGGKRVEEARGRSEERLDSALHLLGRLSETISTTGFDRIRGGEEDAVDGSPGREFENWKKDLNRLVADCASELGHARDALREKRSRREREREDLEKTRARLAHSKGLLGGALEASSSVLIAVDSAGRVLQWNRQAEKISGTPAEIARGSKLEAVFPILSDEMEMILGAIADGEPRVKEKTPWEGDGMARLSDIAVHPLNARGVEGALIRVEDVTRRVRIEEMMIQSEKMMSVGGLAAGMAHEINNPLAGIFQNVQVMKNRVTVGLPRNARAAEEMGMTVSAIQSYLEKRGVLTMIESVMEACLRAKKIVDNMLSFSRKSESKAAPHDLAELMDKTVELAENDYNLKKKYDFREIALTREYHEEAPPALCESSKIQQVILNILKNGAQAMAETALQHPEGDARKEPRFTLRVRGDGDMVRAEIEDNGPGIDKAAQKRIFEPFFTTKPDGVGTGLGLSVSHFIITKDHGGEMTVDSEPGKGTRFIIKLPT
ncbi:MAG: PAS domain S-box protein [Desulfobacterales bacterium]|nr:PAS domain S-box protein [Desulfobacterales bacterium]